MTFKKVARILSVFSFVFLVCSAGIALAGDSPLRIMFHKDVPMLMQLADEKGYWKDEGLSYKVDRIFVGKQALDALMSGHVDVGVIVALNAAFAGFQPRIPFKVLAELSVGNDLSILARRDHGIEKPSDLRGKSIAVIPTAASHYYLAKFLERHDMSIADVKTVFIMSPQAFLAALQQGSIDAAVLWNPHRWHGKQRLGHNAVEFFEPDLYGYHILLAASDDAIRNRPEDLKALLRGLVKAEMLWNEKGEDATKILEEQTEVQPEILADILSRSMLEVKLDQSLINLLNDMGHWYQKTDKGFADRPLPDYRAMIASSLLAAVDPGKETIGGKDEP